MSLLRFNHNFTNSAILCDNIDEEYIQRVNLSISINILFFALIGFLIFVERINEERNIPEEERRNLNYHSV